jgi:CHRD domain
VSRRKLQLVLAIGVVSLLGAVGVAVATGGNGFSERVTGYEEIPTLSTPANGEFKLKINSLSNTIDYELSYRGFETRVQQAHIHLGAHAFNGGISMFLCTNLGNAPTPDTPACPTPSGTVSGTLDADDVVGPAPQGIAPREFDEVVAAIRAGATYANVHTDARPGGEIRAQIESGGDR